VLSNDDHHDDNHDDNHDDDDNDDDPSYHDDRSAAATRDHDDHDNDDHDDHNNAAATNHDHHAGARAHRVESAAGTAATSDDHYRTVCRRILRAVVEVED
jgi:hypothetical protein